MRVDNVGEGTKNVEVLVISDNLDTSEVKLQVEMPFGIFWAREDELNW